MVEYLVEQHDPPIFPFASYCASGACLLVLAQAGCPMGHQHLCQIPKLEQLAESWYTFKGLQQWAADHMSNAGDHMHIEYACDAQHAGGHVSRCKALAAARTDADNKCSPCSSSYQEGNVPAKARCPFDMRASDGLLSLLAGLSSELAGKTASYAFLGPQQASKILTAHPRRCISMSSLNSTRCSNAKHLIVKWHLDSFCLGHVQFHVHDSSGESMLNNPSLAPCRSLLCMHL